MTDDDILNGGSERTLRWLLAVLLLAIVVGGTVDFVLDAPATLWSGHALYELAMIAGALVGAVLLWHGWWRTERSLAETRRALESHRAERDAWRASAQLALEGLGQVIDEQFRRWALTPTEREIALLLLKGRSHKEIAYTTGRSERTVRQHAVAIYQKSGLGGRAELAAFFLGDLALPEGARTAGEGR